MRNQRAMQLLQLYFDNRDKPRDFRAEVGETCELYLYDVIDSWYGISAEDVARALIQFDGRDVEVYLNSPGGDVFEGRTIYSRFKAYPGQVTVNIEGLAASAATTVAMGASRRLMAPGTMFMIHNAWTLDVGDKNDKRKTADLLEKIDSEIIADYVAVTGAETSQFVEWMDAEAWFNPQEAADMGLVDGVLSREAGRAENRVRWNLSAYKNPPAALAVDNDEELFPNRDRLARYADMLLKIGQR